MAKLEYDADKFQSVDETSSVPKGGYSYRESSCQRATTAVEISSESDFAEALQDDSEFGVSYEGGIGPFAASAAFTGSSGYQTNINEIVNKQKSLFRMTSYCLNYVVGFDEGADAVEEAVDAFDKDCKALPVLKGPCNHPCLPR